MALKIRSGLNLGSVLYTWFQSRTKFYFSVWSYCKHVIVKRKHVFNILLFCFLLCLTFDWTLNLGLGFWHIILFFFLFCFWCSEIKQLRCLTLNMKRLLSPRICTRHGYSLNLTNYVFMQLDIMVLKNCSGLKYMSNVSLKSRLYERLEILWEAITVNHVNNTAWFLKYRWKQARGIDSEIKELFNLFLKALLNPTSSLVRWW